LQICVVACAGSSSSSARKWLCNFAKPGVGGLVARFKPSLSDNRFSRGRRRGRGMPLTWPWTTPGCNANCYMPMRSRLMVRWSRKPARNGRLGGSKQKQGLLTLQSTSTGGRREGVGGTDRHSCVSAESPDPRPPVGSGSGRQAVRTLRTPVPPCTGLNSDRKF